MKTFRPQNFFRARDQKQAQPRQLYKNMITKEIPQPEAGPGPQAEPSPQLGPVLQGGPSRHQLEPLQPQCVLQPRHVQQHHRVVMINYG